MGTDGVRLPGDCGLPRAEVNQKAPLILSRELRCGQSWDGGRLQFHREVKNECASFYGTFGMTGIGGLSPSTQQCPVTALGPPLRTREPSFAEIAWGSRSANPPLWRSMCPV